MPDSKNSTPANIWEALRRLLNCNKSQLAQHLGVNRRTLARWEDGEAGADAFARASQLLIATLRAADEADRLAQWKLNLPAIEKLTGKT